MIRDRSLTVPSFLLNLKPVRGRGSNAEAPVDIMDPSLALDEV